MNTLWQKVHSRISKAQKPLLALGIAAALTGLPLSSATAFTPGVDSGGPGGGGVWDVMTRHADAARAGARALATDIKQNDSSLALVCFDRSLLLSARLGGIFSDYPPRKLMPPNASVFHKGKLYNKYAGVGLDNNGNPNMLVNAYGALANTLDTYLGNTGGMALPPPYDQPSGTLLTPVNFSGSITAGMGSTVTTAFPLFLDTIYQFLTNPAVGIYALDELVLKNTLMSDLIALDQMVDPLDNLFDWPSAQPFSSGTLAEILTKAIVATNGALDAAQGMSASYSEDPNVLTNGIPDLYGYLAEDISERKTFYDAYNGSNGGPNYGATSAYRQVFYNAFLAMIPVKGIIGLMASADTSLSGYNWPAYQYLLDKGTAQTFISVTLPNPKRGCNYIADLFGGIPGNQLGITGLTGNGVNPGLPYYTFTDLVTGTMTGAGPAMEHEMGYASGVALGAAQQDLITYMQAPTPSYGSPPALMAAEPMTTGVPATLIPRPTLRSWNAPPVIPKISPASAGLAASPGSPAAIVGLMP
jgi:hypothetical protein